MSIPLAARKAIKEAVPKGEAALKKAGEAVGETLVFTDNTAELWTALGESYQGKLAEGFPVYYETLATVFQEFAKDPLRLAALKDRLKKVGGKVLISIADSNAADNYFLFKTDALHIDVKQSYWGSWMTYYSAAALEKQLDNEWAGHKLPLAVRKNIDNAMPQIADQMKSASAAYGAELKFDTEGLGALYSHVGSRAGEDFGDKVVAYAKQFATTFSEFVKNPDNKEAIQGALKTNKIGFQLAADSAEDKYWIWEGGSLLMQVKAGYFGSWHSYYGTSQLEATL
jgi:hypothetical protein